MSPVKYVFVAGCKVWAVHHDDSHHLMGLGDGEQAAAQIAIGLAMLWHVEARRINDNILDVEEILFRPDDLEAETVHDLDGVIAAKQRLRDEEPRDEEPFQEVATPDVEGQLSMHDNAIRLVES